MPTLTYRARSNKGTIVSGSVDADDSKDAMRRLRREGVQVISIDKEKGINAAVTKLRSTGRRKKKVKTKDVLAMLSQLRLMISSGTGLDDALRIVCDTATNDQFKTVLTDLRDRVNRGEALSRAVAAHPDVFDAILARMIAAGEASGTLPTMLDSVHQLLQRQEDLKRTVRSALAYPCVLMTVAIGALCVLFIWVLPKFAQVFAQVGAELPAITTFVLAISNFIVENKYVLAIGLIAFIFLIRAARASAKIRTAWTRNLMSIPVLGPLIKAANTAKSMQVMGTLWSSGLPITEVTRLTAATVRNPLYQEFFESLQQKLVDGKRIAASFASTNLFPPTVAPLIRTGEETGNTPVVLRALAEHHEKETQGLIKTMMTLMEPAIIVMMAAGVGLIAISVVVPLFRLSSAVH